MSDTIILIPARLGSTRLPNKPLAKINDREMVLHVCDRAKEIGDYDIYVACSEDEVFKIVTDAGYKAIMTDPALPSGTDRIYKALTEIDPDKNFKYIINLQGDLPNVDPKILKETLDLARDNNNVDIATAVVKIDNDEDKNNPNVVKAVTSFDSRDSNEVHYFTRATAPTGEGDLYEHIGIYIYRRDILEIFVSLEPSPLEKREKLEQLRAIEAGMRIYAKLFPANMKPISIDTEDDLRKIKSIIS